MIELKEELSGILKLGKQAITEGDHDLAIQSFEKVIKLASEVSPSLNNIIGISYSYLALASGMKGHRKLALENINKAIEFFPKTPTNPIAYTAVFLGIGVEFQKIGLFECSIIILKIALEMAKSKKKDVDLEAISIVARNLAFSYSKIDNYEASAKLYRIAADLEDSPQISMDLYRNSAYLYYQEGMKDDTINILQTAFEKAEILNDKKTQSEIARFQGMVSYEIFMNFFQRSYFEKAIAYLDLSHEKFNYTGNTFWIIRTLFEKAMIFDTMRKLWQRNKALKKVIRFKIDDKNEEYIIKAILLLAVHALEVERYSKAEYYIKQVSNSQLQNLNPLLVQKIKEIQEILKISQKRGQLYANIHFSRKDLELPVEELIKEAKTPSQDISCEEDLKTLQVPKLEITPPRPSLSSKFKPPSIEALQSLFDSPEIPSTQISLPTYAQKQIPSTSPQEVTSEPNIDVVMEESQEKISSLERLFRAHQVSQEVPTSSISTVSIPSEEAIKLEFQPPDEQPTEQLEINAQTSSLLTPESPRDENIRSEVVSRLQKAGWSVELNFINLTTRGSEPDILAIKGLIRKNRKLIFFAENPADAEICSFLLQSNPDKGEKIIFLINGDPREANVSMMIRIVTQIDQLF